jgi:hemolysin activation/secretion protein
MNIALRNALGTCVGSILGVALVMTDAHAQVRPGTAQPGQVERQFERPPEPTARPGIVTIPAPNQQVPANAEGIRFVLSQLLLDGVTAYKPDALRTLYAASLGTEVTLAQVYRIVDALTARYRNDGYILSQVIVPAQSVENGVVHLQAIEGYVADVRIEGGTAALRARARAHAERIKAQRPLTAGALERNVLLLNDLPGVQARVVLAPGRTPGASDLVLQLTQRRVSASASADSRGSRAQGRQRVFADLDVHNLLGGASLTELRDVTTLTPELSYVAAAHDQYLGTRGGKVSLSASYVYSKPQELSVVPLDLVTTSETVTLTLSYPLLRSRSRNFYIRGSLGGFDSTSHIFGVKDTADRLRTARVGLTYDASDRLGGVNIADVEYSWGLRWPGASRNGDPYLSRANGQNDFQKATLYAARMQTLPASFSMVLAGSGQYAFSDLLAPELFSIGGEQFGRGYDPSELLDDHGAALKLDLRYSHTWNGRHPTTMMPYGFADAGRVWQRSRQPGSDASQTATSAGVGLRLNVGRQLSGFVEVAKPLDRVVGQENSRDPRVYAGVSIQ